MPVFLHNFTWTPTGTSQSVSVPVVLRRSSTSFTTGAAFNSLVTAITGLTGGELSSSLAPNDGRIALSMDRRSILIGLTASAAGTASYALTTSAGRTLSIAITAGAAIVYRAAATGADPTNVIPLTGSTQFSFTRRAVHYSQIDIPAGSVIELMVPLWTVVGANVETMLPEAYAFSASLEYPFTPSLTNIPTNTRTQAVLPGGSGTVFTSNPGDTAFKFVKFYVTVPTTIPARTAYGTWLTHECVAGRTAAVKNKQICHAQGGSAFINRYEGSLATATQGAAHIAANTVMTATTVVALGSVQTGTNTAISVGAIRVPMATSARSVLVNGNSIEQGQQEGYGASGSFGDSFGDQYANRSYAQRLAWKLQIGVAQISQGSDRDSRRLVAGNYAARLAWMAETNPTHVIDMNPHNEIAQGLTAAGGWVSWTAYGQDAAVFTAGGLYISDTAGTSGATAPSGTGAGISDGGVTWTYVGPNDITAGGGASRLCATWVAQRRKRLRMDRAALPTAKFIGVTCTPNSTSAQTSTTYTYSGTTLTITLGDVDGFVAGMNARVTGLTPTSFNAPGNGFSQVAAVDTTNKTVSFTVASGLAAPSGTATINSEWTSIAGQTPGSPYVAGTSVRSTINRFLRSPLALSVLGYVGIIDLGAYLEAGGGTTPGTETGAWKTYVDGGITVGGGATYDGTHPTSRSFEDAAVQAAKDPIVTAALAA